MKNGLGPGLLLLFLAVCVVVVDAVEVVVRVAPLLVVLRVVP